MSKIPFNIKYRPQIESGEYRLETTFGEPARIVKWDCRGKYPLLVIIDDGDTDDAAFFHLDGVGCTEEERLWVVTDEPRLTEFEKAVQEASFLEIHASDEDAIKEQAKHLLAIARKELEKEYDGKAMLHVADKSYQKGKKDALNEMPHWRTARTMDAVGPAVVLTRCDNGLCSAVLSGVVRYGDVYITLQELNKLPRHD